MNLIPEDEVNRVVRRFLEARGWIEVVALTGSARGVDVLGRHPNAPSFVKVESKGGTSGHEGSARFGKTPTPAQVLTHVARAAYTALAYREQSKDDCVLIAVPDDTAHRLRISRIQGVLRALDIGALAVSHDRVEIVFGRTAPS